MFVQREWDSLKQVIMHRPDTEIDYAMLAPRAFLFERPFNKRKALEEHRKLESVLKENGVQVTMLRDIATEMGNTDKNFRQSMEEKVASDIQFFGDLEDAEKEKAELKRNLPYMDSDTLFNIMILCPSIDIRIDEATHMYYPKIFSNVPLTNLYFMRDQQAVSNKGAIVGRMRLPQRKKEPEITSFILNHKLGSHNTVRVESTGYFEGGDYIPCGEFGLIGIGSRTDINGALSAMNSGMMTHDEILVVNNPKYEFQVKDLLNNMHLDTYFNIAGDGIAIGSRMLAENAMGTVYARNGNIYEEVKDTTLFDYMKEKNFAFLDLNPIEQLCYASNFLTISDKKVTCIDSYSVLQKLLKNNVITPDVIRRSGVPEEELRQGMMFPNRKKMSEFGLDYIEINLEEITGGYGGAHCMTMSLSR